MENIAEILAQFSPKKLEVVLKTFVAIWQQQIKDTSIQTPHLGLHLSNGQFLVGELVQIDFPAELIGLRMGNHEESLDIHIIPFRKVEAYSLHQLQHCQIFVKALAQG